MTQMTTTLKTLEVIRNPLKAQAAPPSLAHLPHHRMMRRRKTSNLTFLCEPVVHILWTKLMLLFVEDHNIKLNLCSYEKSPKTNLVKFSS